MTTSPRPHPSPASVLLLPGWQGCGPDHWQTRWAQRHGYRQVAQHDWQRPRRGDWTARLQDEVLACDEDQPVWLVAHGLGCILLAWWAAHSPSAGRVAGVLLVAPPDMVRQDIRLTLPGWAPAASGRLPFPGLLVASHDDPQCGLAQAHAMACDWGVRFLQVGACGHIGADARLGDWDEGHAWLLRLFAGELSADARNAEALP